MVNEEGRKYKNLEYRTLVRLGDNSKLPLATWVLWVEANGYTENGYTEGWLWLLRYKETAGNEEYHNGGGKNVMGAVIEKEKSQLNNISPLILALPH